LLLRDCHEALSWQAAYKQRPPAEAIVFIVGGSTYEEAKAVAEWNSRGPQAGMRVLLRWQRRPEQRCVPGGPGCGGARRHRQPEVMIRAAERAAWTGG